jgi:hypothetical protein
MSYYLSSTILQTKKYYLYHLIYQVVIGDVQKNDIAKILQKASAMESPQDLRYSVFALGSVQQSSEVMQQHLAPIRRACIVSMLGPRTFRMELRGGFVADVAVHECYPDVRTHKL